MGTGLDHRETKMLLRLWNKGIILICDPFNIDLYDNLNDIELNLVVRVFSELGFDCSYYDLLNWHLKLRFMQFIWLEGRE